MLSCQCKRIESRFPVEVKIFTAQQRHKAHVQDVLNRISWSLKWERFTFLIYYFL